MTPHLTTSAIPEVKWRCGRALREGAQVVDVDEHAGRLVEGADEVLAGLVVDAGLPPYGGVDHADERGRDLHVRDAAIERRGHESDQVTDHAAAQRHQGGVPAGAKSDDGVLDLVADAAGLAPLTGGEGDQVTDETSPPKAGQERLAVARVKVGIGDDDVSAAHRAPPEMHRQARAEPPFDEDVVRLLDCPAQPDA
jgi:hypothetical protein